MASNSFNKFALFENQGRLVYVAVTTRKKNFGFRKKNMPRDKLTTPIYNTNILSRAHRDGLRD